MQCTDFTRENLKSGQNGTKDTFAALFCDSAKIWKMDLGSQLTQFPFYSQSSTTLLLFFKIVLNFARILESLEIENLHNGCIRAGVERDVVHLKFKLLHIYRSYVIHLNFNLNCYTFIDQMSFN